jgi:hypothetical protein
MIAGRPSTSTGQFETTRWMGLPIVFSRYRLNYAGRNGYALDVCRRQLSCSFLYSTLMVSGIGKRYIENIRPEPSMYLVYLFQV